MGRTFEKACLSLCGGDVAIPQHLSVRRACGLRGGGALLLEKFLKFVGIFRETPQRAATVKDHNARDLLALRHERVSALPAARHAGAAVHREHVRAIWPLGHDGCGEQLCDFSQGQRPSALTIQRR